MSRAAGPILDNGNSGASLAHETQLPPVRGKADQ